MEHRMSFSNVISTYIKPIKEWYSEINSATLTGAIDVIVIEQPDGTYMSSPFHVRFGKLGVLKAREKIVDIEVDGRPVELHMKLDDNGAAFFVEPEEGLGVDIPPELATSPMPDVHLPERRGSTGSSSSSREPEGAAPKEAETVKCKLSKKKRKRRPPPKHPRASAANEPEGEEGGSSDDIFAMEDVDREAGRDPSGGPTPTLEFKLEKPFMSSSVPATPISLHRHEEPGRVWGATANLAATLSSSLSKLNDGQDPEDPSRPRQAPEDSFLLSRLPLPENFDEILQKHEEKGETLVPNKEAKAQYFSEPEMSPVATPTGSRPSTPVMSDTEVESRRNDEPEGSEETNWEWGQLPSNEKRKKEFVVGSGKEDASPDPKESRRGWGLSYLWRGSSKKLVDASAATAETAAASAVAPKDDPLKPEPAVYLHDVEDDEEMLKIYVGSHLNNRQTNAKTNPMPIIEDDVESGNGPSLPMSPHSVEGSIGGPLTKFETEHDPRKLLKDVDVSLCGGLDSPQGFSNLLFEQGKLAFDDFAERLRSKDAKLFNHPDLVVRIGRQYYTWTAACPIIMSWVLYGRGLPSDLVDVVTGSYQEVKSDGESAALPKRSSSWWPFGSKVGAESSSKEGSKEVSALKEEAKESNAKRDSGDKNEATVRVEVEGPEITEEPMENIGRKQRSLVNLSTSSDCSTADELLFAGKKPCTGKYRKTLRLSSDCIKRLNLKRGSNEAQFSVTTAFQGTTRCSCHIYLWKWTDKIVISDVDGTITKSDVLGHVLPIIGRDWAQSGVASLFNKIKNNGYHIAYVSSRSIGHASITKDYLKSVIQGDVNLPDGPLLLNPTSLVKAIHREVIINKPEEFKIACLRDIQKLFPDCDSTEGNPFYAGYGNRVNDVWAYRAVKIPYSRIFTVNPSGELKHDLTETFQTSYNSQGTIVDHIFPPRRKADDNPSSALTYSSFTFWREPLPEFDIENELK